MERGEMHIETGAVHGDLRASRNSEIDPETGIPIVVKSKGGLKMDKNNAPEEGAKVHGGKNGDWVDRSCLQRLPEINIGEGIEQPWLRKICQLKFNPRVVTASTLIIWTFIILCLTQVVTKDDLSGAKAWLTQTFTWLYIGTQQVWAFFIAYLFFSKYGNLKLGKKDELPEFGLATWFMMLFAAGVGVGLFYYGVAEPVMHYDNTSPSKNRYMHLNSNERSQHAMNLTWYHWGLHGWVVYSIVGLSMAVMAYRKDLPVTMRSCFYPLLGDKVMGPFGDAIDVISAVSTIFGVCTSLGIGVMDLTKGISRITGCDTLDENTCSATPACLWRDMGLCKSKEQFCGEISTQDLCENNENKDVCSWIYKMVETKTGEMKRDGYCSSRLQVCQMDSPLEEFWQASCTPDEKTTDFNIGFSNDPSNLIMLVWIISAVATMSAVTGMKMGVRALSVFTFSIGMFLMIFVFFSGNPWYYLDVITLQMGLYMQTFLNLGTHTDAYARHTRAVDAGMEPAGCPNSGFLNSVAHEEKWYCCTQNVFDNTCQEMDMVAAQITGEKWIDGWTMFYWGWWISWSPFVGMFIAKISRGRTIREFISGTITAPALYAFIWFGIFGSDGLRMERMAEFFELDKLTSPAYMVADTTKKIVCTTADRMAEGVDCVYVSRLSARGTQFMWMDMISQYWGTGTFMMAVSMFAITLYFVTSADSGSLVVDCLASNGSELSPPIQKIYWAVTVGAASHALIFAGGPDSLTALQSASICAGLPYTVMMCFMCQSLWMACKYEWGDSIWRKDRFFRQDLMEAVDFRFEKGYFRTLSRCLLAVICPVWFLRSSMKHTTIKMAWKRVAFLITLGALFYLLPFFIILDYCIANVLHGAWVFGLWWYICFVTGLAAFRADMRTRHNIDGDFLQDWFGSFFFYFLICEQLDVHFRSMGAGKLEVDDSGCMREKMSSEMSETSSVMPDGM